jgi:hypothetical protein
LIFRLLILFKGITMTATYQELIEQREALDRQIQEVKEQEKRIGLEKVLALIEEFAREIQSKKITVLESLRGTHPELFLLSLSPEDSNVRCVRNKYNLDVTKDDVLEVLLRPHVDLICNGKAGKIRANSVWIFINK